MIRKIANGAGWALIAVVAAFTVLLLGPRLAGIQEYAVLTGSMTPTIPQGALVFVRPGGEIAAGDVITFRDGNGTIVTHRVAAVNAAQDTYTTQGDANNMPDTAPVGRGQVLGKVVFHLPWLGAISQSLKTPAGITAVCAAILILFLSVLIPAVMQDIRRAKGRR